MEATAHNHSRQGEPAANQYTPQTPLDHCISSLTLAVYQYKKFEFCQGQGKYL
jgi:hypothetical protein